MPKQKLPFIRCLLHRLFQNISVAVQRGNGVGCAGLVVAQSVLYSTV